MRLVEDDQIAVQIFPRVHRIVELISEDLGGSDDDWGVGVLLRVSGDDADIHRAEEVAEFDPFGIGQGLQGGGIPAAPALLEDRSDRLFGDPCFPRAGRGHDKAVVGADGVKCFKLKGIRPELCGSRLADFRKNRLQQRVRIRFHPETGPCPSASRGDSWGSLLLTGSGGRRG